MCSWLVAPWDVTTVRVPARRPGSRVQGYGWWRTISAGRDSSPEHRRTPDRLRPALPGGTAGAGPEELTEGCMVSCFHCASAIHVPPDLVGQATRHARERSEIPQGSREPSAQRQHENLTSALGTRAVGALEDLALDVAAMASAPGAHGHIPRRRGPRTRGAAGTELTPPDSDLRSRADPTAAGG
jgi:hypothetical protein